MIDRLFLYNEINLSLHEMFFKYKNLRLFSYTGTYSIYEKEYNFNLYEGEAYILYTVRISGPWTIVCSNIRREALTRRARKEMLRGYSFGYRIRYG